MCLAPLSFVCILRQQEQWVQSSEPASVHSSTQGYTAPMQCTHALDHSSSQTSDFAPNGSNSQVLYVDGWTKSDIGSKVHRDLITERSFCPTSDRGTWNTLWPSGHEERTILQHCCCLGSLMAGRWISKTCSQPWTLWFRFPVLQLMLQQPCQPCKPQRHVPSMPAVCVCVTPSPCCPASLSYHSPEIPAEHHQHQQNHVSSHTGLH